MSRSEPAPNLYQASTSPAKLRGEYYTPPALVSAVLDRLDLRPGDVVLDPSCGDGSFLAAARNRLAEGGRIPAGSLVGLELSPIAAEEAARRLGADGRILQADALEKTGRASLERLLPGIAHRRLVVVGNPPYVEAKRLAAADRARLKRLLPDACAGAPDLYLYFLHVALGWLRGSDRLALVLPNRVLLNAGALPVRRRLVEQGALEGVDFATRERLFGDASVYPVVLYAQPEGGPDAPVTQRFLTRRGSSLQAEVLPPSTTADFRATESLAIYPVPSSPVLAGTLRRLVRPGSLRLGDLVEVRWTVSFHRAGLRQQFVTPHRPPGPHARPFLGGGPFTGNGEVERYRMQWAGWWIDYDRGRAAAARNALPPLELFDPPRLVICQYGRTLRAALDESGYVLKDTFLCGRIGRSSHPLATHPRALVGLLCSLATHFIAATLFHGGHVNGGYLHFLPHFLRDLPLGEWSEANARAAEEHVKALETRPPPAEAAAHEAALEGLTAEALGLDAAERTALREWGRADENWLQRDRIRRPKTPARG